LFEGDFQGFDDLLSKEVGVAKIMGLPAASMWSPKMSGLAGFGAVQKVLGTPAN
jgi:hypothetical protein